MKIRDERPLSWGINNLVRAKPIDDTHSKWIEGIIITDNILRNFQYGEVHDYKIVPSTICPYSQFHDKYGKKIFADDIVLFEKAYRVGDPSEYNYNGVVQFLGFVDIYNEKFYISRKNGEGPDGNGLDSLLLCSAVEHMDIFNAELKVIGNTFDNPELLGSCVD